MPDEVVLTHPALPGVEYPTSRPQFETVWAALGWVKSGTTTEPVGVRRAAAPTASTKEN
ncbi:hypothetical protein AB0A77_28300 [Streptomyces varsoviensis]|uniref:hypothetical protein n=1 Tax=Streptomyces varsoviensis TaxID=67373 RepID=UPI00340992A5